MLQAVQVHIDVFSSLANSQGIRPGGKTTDGVRGRFGGISLCLSSSIWQQGPLDISEVGAYTMDSIVKRLGRFPIERRDEIADRC